MRSSIQIEGKDGRLQEVGVICPPDPDTEEGRAEIMLFNAKLEKALRVRATFRGVDELPGYAQTNAEGQSVKKSDQNIT